MLVRSRISRFSITLVCALGVPACSSESDDVSTDQDVATDAATDTASDAGVEDTADADEPDLTDVATEDTGVDSQPTDADEDTAAVDTGVDSSGDTATDPEQGDVEDTTDDSVEIDVDVVSDAAPDVVDETPWIELGTGWDELDPYGGFEPLDDHGTVRIAEGIQGGFHVWGGFEGYGMDESDVESAWQLTTEDGHVIGGGFFVSDMRPRGEHLATAGLTVFIALDIDVSTLDGVPHQLCVDVTMADGATLNDCATVRPSCCDYL